MDEYGLIFCLVVLAVQLVVHFVSWIPNNHISQLESVVVWLPTLVCFAMSYSVPDNPFLRHFGRRKQKVQSSSAASGQIAAWVVLPLWFRRTLAVVGIYLAITFAAAFDALRHGAPEHRSGEYWAGNYKLGIPYRQITEAEYWRLVGHMVRMLVGMGVVIALIPVASFVWDRSRPGRKPGKGT